MTTNDTTTTGFKPTRRTFTRGAAWTVPVVAMAATAPAFASSPVPPRFGELTACKLPGKSTDTEFGYRFTVPYNGTAEQLSIVTLTLNGRQYTPTEVVADGRNLTFKVTTTNSADAAGTGSVTFTFNGETLTQTFSYDGTKPCKP